MPISIVTQLRHEEKTRSRGRQKEIVGSVSLLSGKDGSTRTAESPAALLQKATVTFQVGNKINLGKTYSAEHRKKLSLVRKGIVFSPETLQKMSLAKIGCHFPNRKSSPRTAEHSAAISRGQLASPKRANMGMHRPRTEDEKRRISKAMKGVKKSAATCEKMRLAMYARPPIGKSWDTIPERRVALAATLLFPDSRRNSEVTGARKNGLFRRVDWLCINAKLAIEMDGCYWHGCPQHFPNFKPPTTRWSMYTNLEKDILTNAILPAMGWTLLRVWEHDAEAFAQTCAQLHRMICDGTITPADAQHQIATDWYAAYKRYVKPSDAKLGR